MKKKLIASVLALATCFAFGGALAGCSGKDGATGATGAAGAAGKSAYEIWLDAGNTGSEADFLESLKGSGSAVCNHENMMKAELINFAGIANDEFVHTATPVYDEESGEIIDWEFTPGKVLNVCVDCGYSKITEEVYHVMDTYTDPATCEEVGYTITGCPVCEYFTEREELEKLPHNIDTSNPENGVAVVDGNNACVDEDAYVAFKCADCDYVEVINEYDRYHYVTEWKLSVDEKHVEGTCSRFCGETVVLELPAIAVENYAYTAPSCVDGANAKEIYEIYVANKVNEKDAEAANFATVATEGYELVKVKEVKKAGVHTANGEAMPTNQKYVMNGEESYADVITEVDGGESTCAVDGSGVFTCDACKKPVIVKTYQEHTVKTWSKVDADLYPCQTGIKGTCTVCKEEIVEEGPEHEWDYIIAANEKSATQKCTVCGTEGETLQIKEVISRVDSTCKDKGILTVKLNDGKDTVAELELGLVGHTAMIDGEKVAMNETKYDITKYGSVITEVADNEANCGKNNGEGLGIYTCADCAKPVTVTTWVDHVAKEGSDYVKPTCTTPGSVECKNCEQTITLDPLAPVYEYTLVAVDADYTVFALFADCKNCEAVELTDGDAEAEEVLHHYCVAEDLTLYVAETNEDGEVIKTKIENAACGKHGYAYVLVYEGKEVRCYNDADKVAHVYGEIVMNKASYDITEYDFITEVADKESSCKGEGVVGQGIYTCTACSKPVSVATTRAHDVDYDSASEEDKQAATCTVNGWVDGTCKFCKDEVRKTIEAKGHTLTYKVEGDYVVFGCAICNADEDDTNDFSKSIALSLGEKKVEEVTTEATCAAGGVTYYEYLFSAEVMSTVDGFEREEMTVKFEVKTEAEPHVCEKYVTWTTTYTEVIEVEEEVEGEPVIVKYTATFVVTHRGYFCASGCGKLIETSIVSVEEDESLREIYVEESEEESEEELA